MTTEHTSSSTALIVLPQTLPSLVAAGERTAWTSGRIQTERYGFTLHEPAFDFLNGFSGQFIAQKSP